jgi:hypothetical protein
MAKKEDREVEEKSLKVITDGVKEWVKGQIKEATSIRSPLKLAELKDLSFIKIISQIIIQNLESFNREQVAHIKDGMPSNTNDQQITASVRPAKKGPGDYGAMSLTLQDDGIVKENRYLASLFWGGTIHSLKDGKEINLNPLAKSGITTENLSAEISADLQSELIKFVDVGIIKLNKEENKGKK